MALHESPNRADGGSACGKVTLCGEHFVLFGAPALALPWRGGTLRLRAAGAPVVVDPAWASRLLSAWNLAREAAGLPAAANCPWGVESTIPAGAGLGSSAALSVVLVRAACVEAGVAPDDAVAIRAAALVEGVFHGRSSGLDPAAVILERPVLRDEEGGLVPVPWCLPAMDLVLALAPGTRRTAEAVTRAQAHASARPGPFRELLDTAAELVREVAGLLADPRGAAGASRLGALLTANHRLLRELGVSTPILDRMVAGALEAGALGSKMCGAGLGGVVLALPPPGGVAAVAEALAGAGAERILPWRVPRDGEAAK